MFSTEQSQNRVKMKQTYTIRIIQLGNTLYCTRTECSHAHPYANVSPAHCISSAVPSVGVLAWCGHVKHS